MKKPPSCSLCNRHYKVVCITIIIVNQLIINYQAKCLAVLRPWVTDCLRGVGCLGWVGLVAAGLLPGRLLAQGPGGVSGTLLDQRTRQPLPFANVLLRRRSDSTLIATTQTAENGTFALTNLALGQYVVRAEALGYQSARRAATLGAVTPVVRLGEWLVAPTAVQLGGVVVLG